DPDRIEFRAWLRFGSRLHPVINTQGWISPGLKIRFEIVDNELIIFRPDGRKFLTPLETELLAEAKVRHAETKAGLERERAEKAEKLAEAERKKARKLAEKLRSLGIDPETV
ncbi:MAG: hypothetical protein BWK80_38895, partial [Desulfobacteraceae bacterium IS3]